MRQQCLQRLNNLYSAILAHKYVNEAMKQKREPRNSQLVCSNLIFAVADQLGRGGGGGGGKMDCLVNWFYRWGKKTFNHDSHHTQNSDGPTGGKQNF